MPPSLPVTQASASPSPGLAPPHARSLGLWPPNHHPRPPHFFRFPVGLPGAGGPLPPQPGVWPPSWQRPAPHGQPPRSAPARPPGGRHFLPGPRRPGRWRRRRRPPSHGRPGEPRGRLRGGGSDSRGRPGRAADAVSAMGRAGRAPPGLRGSLPSTSRPAPAPALPPPFLGDTPRRRWERGGLLFPRDSPGKPHFRPAGYCWGGGRTSARGCEDPGALEPQVPNRLGSREHL